MNVDDCRKMYVAELQELRSVDLGFGEDERVLHDILQEEKRADEKLSRLAERDLNREAAEHIQSTTYARQTASPLPPRG